MQFFEFRAQRIVPQIDGDDPPVGIQQEVVRDRLDTEHSEQTVIVRIVLAQAPHSRYLRRKDFSKIIKQAKTCKPPAAVEQASIAGGFAHHQATNRFQIAETVKSGNVRQFAGMAGGDGHMKYREYDTASAKALPHNTVLLTAEYAEYRYNKLEPAAINDIPRALNTGQSNDRSLPEKNLRSPHGL